MARNKLLVLLKVRKQGVDHARAQVAACLESEQRVGTHLQSIDEQRRLDQVAREAIDEAWRHEDMFAAAHRRHAERKHLLTNELRAATSRSEAARHALSRARMAAEAVERVMEARQAAARQEADRLQQHALDDISRALWLRRRGTQASQRDRDDPVT